MLCGVEVEHSLGLLGHSDADVAVHALIDALLGASALGDVGLLFPDSDPSYAGISSVELLRRVVELLHTEGWVVGNVDVTVVCERPRLAGYRDRMREALAVALSVGVDAVSVKATTSEGMGFEGRGEGISSAAVALLTRAEGLSSA